MRIHKTDNHYYQILMLGVLLLIAQYTPSLSATEITHYQSGDGISRWQLSSKGVVTQQWNQLKDIQTFTPVEQDGVVLVGSTNGLYALDSEHGGVRWQQQIGKTIFTPVIQNGVTYTASRDGLLHAYETANGQSLWQHQLSGWLYPPAISGTVLFTGGSDGTLWALSSKSGELLWQQNLNQEMVFRPVVTIDNAVVVTTFSGDVMAFHVEDGRQLWHTRLTTPAFSAISDGERLFFTSYRGLIRALNSRSGALLWKLETNGDYTQQLLLADGQLLATHEQGILLINPTSGQQLKQHLLPGIPIGKPSIHEGQIRLFYQQSGLIGLTHLNL